MGRPFHIVLGGATSDCAVCASWCGLIAAALRPQSLRIAEAMGRQKGTAQCENKGQ
jgi:hypothetical protein